MKCPKTDTVSAYLDGELCEAKKGRFEMHVQGCSLCRNRLESYQRLSTALVESERQTAPAWFSSRVRSRVTAQSSKPLVLFPFMVRMAQVIVVLLMITIGIISGRLLVNGGQGQMTANISSVFSLDVFDAAPLNSPGGVYVAMMEDTHEE